MRMFGSLIRSLRQAQDLSRDELADRIGYSKSLVAMIERGVRMPSQAFIDKGEEVLEARGVLRGAAPFLSRERYPWWFGEYVDREAEAVSVYTYNVHVLHGLVQTEHYARSVLGARYPILDGEEIDRRVQARLARQSLLSRTPAVSLALVIEEWVLRRPIGGHAVLRGQLERLLELTAMRNVSVQVMPMTRKSHAGFNGPWTLLETPERDWLAYVEGQAGGLVIDDRKEVSELHGRYGMIRSQALSTEDSAKLIEQMAGEL
ncbi:hypothetical protein CRI70_19175 [Streptomyces sp. Ru87]|uniref:Helix-turn-helix transcriptional regulator n=2 Tax=Streptomyces TaxID=1883 RepID=A0ABQ7FFJ0_9ACTN|nr:helix-turn-helix transcriptional regulator [Streptomyces lycii]PGH49184.1 hypothetical protein CRI70_19175 [Streptomyces sp. Ru87]